MKFKRKLPRRQSKNNPSDDGTLSDDQAQCFKLALYYLNRRDRTKKELEGKLSQRNFSNVAIAPTLAKLEDLSFIDDERFTRNYVRNSLLGKPKGQIRLKFELKRKGVDEEVIESALSSEWPEDDKELINVQARKIIEKNSRLAKDKIYNRALGGLIRRGFSYSDAKKAVISCLDERD